MSKLTDVELKKYVDLFVPYVVGKNKNIIVEKKATREYAYLWDRIPVSESSLDAVDREFMNAWPTSKYFDSVSHYGDFSTGYITLVKPDLYEVAYVLAKSLKLEELSKFDRIYVTTHTELATPKIERYGNFITPSSTINILLSTFHFVTHASAEILKTDNKQTDDNTKTQPCDTLDDNDIKPSKKVRVV